MPRLAPRREIAQRRRQPQRPADAPRGIEGGDRTDVLLTEDRDQPGSYRCRGQDAALDLGQLPADQSLTQHAPDQLALVLRLEAEKRADRAPDIGIAYRCRIDKARTEIRPDHRH